MWCPNGCEAEMITEGTIGNYTWICPKCEERFDIVKCPLCGHDTPKTQDFKFKRKLILDML